MNKNYPVCQLCNKSLNSEKQFIQHKKGKYHLSFINNSNIFNNLGDIIDDCSMFDSTGNLNYNKYELKHIKNLKLKSFDD